MKSIARSTASAMELAGNEELSTPVIEAAEPCLVTHGRHCIVGFLPFPMHLQDGHTGLDAYSTKDMRRAGRKSESMSFGGCFAIIH